MRTIYLDHNATTPVRPEVSKAMEPFGEVLYGNPSSLHQAGIKVARELKQTRREIASFLGAQDETEIVFTSGGTESNNTAFRSALWTQKARRNIVTTAVEHSSILKLSRALEEEGVRITYLPVTSEGGLQKSNLQEDLTDETALVSVMMANNETGVLFPIEEIRKEVQEKGILFHVDAVQAVGKIPLSLRTMPVDFLSLSAHKFGGPKGIGVLYVKEGASFRPLCFGGSQERGRRAGTENVPGMIGLGAACRKLQNVLREENQKTRNLRDHFEREILRTIPGVQINGSRQNRLPNTSNLAFEGVDAEALLILLDQEGVCASSGSACISGAPEPSHVLKAMGFSDARAKGSVRFSFGHENTSQEVDEVIPLLQRLIGRLREIELKEQHPHSIIQ